MVQMLQIPAPAAAELMMPVLPTQFGDPLRFESMQTSLLQVAGSYSNALLFLAASLQPPVIDPKFPTITTAPLPVTAALPVLRDVNWLTPADPGAFSGTLDTHDLVIPPFTVIPPVLSFGTTPVPSFGLVPDSPGVETEFDFPTLTLDLPPAPQLMSLETVRFDGVTLPTFSATEPVLTAVAPNIVVYEEAPRYTSTLLSALEADLKNAVEKGEFITLDGSVETAMWDRAREREYRQAADAIAALDAMEATGFSLPPGIWFDGRLKIETELANAIAGASREIMIKQAELMLENLVKARESATVLEGKQIEYANQIAQRAFEAVKYQTEAQVQIFNALVAKFTAQMEGYRAAAMVYDYQIKGALAIAEIFKVEVQAELAKAQINHELVAMYHEQIAAEALNVDIFKAELGAIETKANIQKLKVEVFGEQIKAYVGQVSAYTSQVEAYKANAEAQTAVEGAYKAQVESYKVQVDAGVAQINSRIETYKANIGAYTARLEAYKAALQAMTEQARAAALYNTSQAEVYKAEIAGLSSYNGVLTQQWQAVADIAEKQAEVGVQAAKAQGDLYIATKNLAIEAAKTGATISGQLGAAALNAIHFSTSASWSQTLSQSISDSASSSTSESMNENDNKNETA